MTVWQLVHAQSCKLHSRLLGALLKMIPSLVNSWLPFWDNRFYPLWLVGWEYNADFNSWAKHQTTSLNKPVFPWYTVYICIVMWRGDYAVLLSTKRLHWHKPYLNISVIYWGSQPTSPFMYWATQGRNSDMYLRLGTRLKLKFAPFWSVWIELSNDVNFAVDWFQPKIVDYSLWLRAIFDKNVLPHCTSHLALEDLLILISTHNNYFNICEIRQ